ncbi:unnamed protein product, partial [marine sediment metagenome]
MIFRNNKGDNRMKLKLVHTTIIRLTAPYNF